MTTTITIARRSLRRIFAAASPHPWHGPARSRSLLDPSSRVPTSLAPALPPPSRSPLLNALSRSFASPSRSSRVSSSRARSEWRQPPPPSSLPVTRFDQSSNNRNSYEYFASRQPPFYRRPKFWFYAAGVGGVAGIYYVTHLEVVPMSGRTRYMDISKYEEDMLSKQAYEEIMAQFGSRIVPVTHPLSRFVQRVAGNIIRVSGMTDLEWEVHLIDYPQRNAFVLPGGKVFVFTGILPVVGDENGLAAVLGHEIAHQVARHSAEKMSWVKVIVLGQILLSFFFDPGFIFNRLFMELGVMMPFSRLCESEADLIGLKLMAQACYDPRAAIRMWENMKVADGGERQMEYLSTHPSHENRIAKITEWMPEALEIREKSDCKEVSPLWGLFKRLR